MSKTKGGLISFNNFLSTSKKREVSLGFAQHAATNPDLVGILFIMQIDPTQSTTPFASIREAYSAIGENSTALSYYEKAVAIRQRSHCSDHPDLAYSYNNIGNVYYSMGNYSEALSSHEKALAIRQQSLPSNHPHLAKCYNDIGLVYETMNNYIKAHSYFECATEIGQHSLPSNHPELLKFFW
ncbi:unnamed protein product [Rotaria sordida]|uniref:Uncharacterized protein n=1 Tax=Rotaria sordida TaxID=392033 RepID=A0A819N2K1_9BILA|nr:unnamed protein product [Rotaria sordida]CAF3987474.1 unnamed protein product [Rotaria sordida]